MAAASAFISAAAGHAKAIRVDGASVTGRAATSRRACKRAIDCGTIAIPAPAATRANVSSMSPLVA